MSQTNGLFCRLCGRHVGDSAGLLLNEVECLPNCVTPDDTSYVLIDPTTGRAAPTVKGLTT